MKNLFLLSLDAQHICGLSSVRKFGFTLPEVLITLGIIGVVACMTIPTLIADSQKTIYVNQLKKAYTQFNQVLIQISADDGCVGDLKCTGLFDPDTTSYEAMGDEIAKHFKLTKNCKSNNGGPSITGCFSDKVSDNYNGSGLRRGWDNVGFYRFITEDGNAYFLGSEGSNCGSEEDGYSNHKTNNMNQMCGQVLIDVNGPGKGPNNFGRDIFAFYITNGKGPLLYPAGGLDDNANEPPWANDDGSLRNCYPDSVDGASCAGRVIEENWQMNY